MFCHPVLLIHRLLLVILFSPMLTRLEGRICDKPMPGLDSPSHDAEDSQAEHNERVCWDPSCVEIASGKVL
jgi:hypothetical protein